ncbi:MULTISPECIES: hypothetical protein [unclassified Enterococcus]|uniref:hypothetical protein n=1 Tax=unclassified Enterococcus TaxID=2608891 RepID=UPI0013EC9567|nr:MULTISPECIES: hypothetical protein [unclassified Enterococcus]
MKILKEETDELYKKYDLLLDYVILFEPDYQGIDSHQEAAIAFLEYENDRWYQWSKRIKPVPKPVPFLEFVHKKWVQQKMTDKSSMMTFREYFRERRSLKRRVCLYDLVKDRVESDIVYTDWTSFDHIHDYPIHLNKHRMLPKPMDFEEMFQPESFYEGLFFNTPSQTVTTKEGFLELNDTLFPNKENLIAYSWNNSWSSYFSLGREWWGAYLWTIYDPIEKRFVVIGASTSS